VPFWRPRGCVLWLDLLEPKGDTAYDKSGYENHGTIYGATRVRALGRYGLSFDGINDYVEVPDSMSLDIVERITIEFMINPILDGTITANHLIGKRTAGVWTDNYTCFFRGNGEVSFAIFGVGSVKTAVGVLKSGVWNHLVFLYDGFEMKIYVNTNIMAFTSATGAITPNDQPIIIGTREDFVYYIEGMISFVRIYNRALSEREIRANYAYFFSRIKRAV